MSANKVSRVIEQYELTGVEESLVRDWTQEDDQRRKSIRELTSWFNQKLVMVILDEYTSGMIPSEYTIEGITKRLQARDSSASKYDDISDREIMTVVQWLQDNDVPVDDIIDDLVSYGTMYTYLKEVRGAVSPDSQPDQRSQEKRQSDVLESIRTDFSKQPERINSRLRTLRAHNQLPGTKADIHISVECNCPACGHAQPIADYIEQQGCTECEMHTRDELTPDQTNHGSHEDRDENTP